MTHEKELLEKNCKARAGAITAGEAGNIGLGKLRKST